MVAKSFNLCLPLCNYIITICSNNINLLTTQVLLKSGDIGINPGPKNHLPLNFAIIAQTGLLP